MQISGFEFKVFEIDDCRVIEAVYPPVVDVSRLAETISYYYDLWDEEVPTASLVGLHKLERLGDDVRKILLSVVRRTVLQPSFVDGAWYVGANAAVRDEIVALLELTGRSGASVFETREEAIDYLRRSIRFRGGA